MLVKLFAVLLVLNIAAYAVHSRAQSVDEEFSWVTGYHSPAHLNETAEVDITRADCVRRAINHLLTKVGLTSSDPLLKTQRSARFGELDVKSDYAISVSDKSFELKLKWNF